MENVDLSEISGSEIRTALLKLVEKKVKSKNIKVRIEPGSKKGDNFIGLIYRILYEKIDGDNDDKKQSSLILKIASQNPVRRDLFRLKVFFMRETVMYMDVLKYFNEFQLSKGVIPEENGFNEYAKCYRSIDTEMSESLLLEDLRTKQMEMLNHRECELTFEHVALVMKALGKFHAISFALKDQQPNKFAQLVERLPEVYYQDNDHFRNFFKITTDRVFESLERSNRPDLDKKLKAAISTDFLQTGLELVSGKIAEPYAVICHGDAWMNNCMFRTDAQETPIAVSLIDWQFSRYASPITDILINLMCCTSKELRDAHYDDLIKIYYNSLSDLLKRLGSDPKKLFPYDAFEKQLKTFGKYGAIVGSLLIPLISSDISSIPDLDEITDRSEVRGFQMTGESQLRFDTQIVNMIDDMAQLGYI